MVLSSILRHIVVKFLLLLSFLGNTMITPGNVAAATGMYYSEPIQIQGEWKFKLELTGFHDEMLKLNFLLIHKNRIISRSRLSSNIIHAVTFKNVPTEIKSSLQKNKQFIELTTTIPQIINKWSELKTNQSINKTGNSGLWNEVGQGWKFRVDPPHTGSDTGKWHIHVNKGDKKIASEGIDGSPSHGQTMEGEGVPKKVQDQIKNHPEYKKGKKKQEELDKAINEVRKKKMKRDNSNVWNILLAIGIIVAATSTFFFPGDDLAAWLNFFRAIKLA